MCAVTSYSASEEETARIEASPTAHRAGATHVVSQSSSSSSSSASAAVHVEPNHQSRLAAQLPAGTPIRGRSSSAAGDSDAGGDSANYADWMQLEQPIRGWIRNSDVHACEDGSSISDQAACTAALFAAMQASRDEAVGSRSPMGKCKVASQRLLGLLNDQPSLERALKSLNLYPVEYRHGGFASPPEPDFRRWHAHAFLLFADGSIGDLTSDQFGGPQLAWPADERRYNKAGQRPIV